MRRRRSRPCSSAIHAGDPDPKLLSYQYLQMLPQLAQGDANKVFVIPSEFTEAFGGISRAFTGAAKSGDGLERQRDRPGGELGPVGAALAGFEPALH